MIDILEIFYQGVIFIALVIAIATCCGAALYAFVGVAAMILKDEDTSDLFDVARLLAVTCLVSLVFALLVYALLHITLLLLS